MAPAGVAAPGRGFFSGFHSCRFAHVGSRATAPFLKPSVEVAGVVNDPTAKLVKGWTAAVDAVFLERPPSQAKIVGGFCGVTTFGSFQRALL
jgi:hypothetical protein